MRMTPDRANGAVGRGRRGPLGGRAVSSFLAGAGMVVYAMAGQSNLVAFSQKTIAPFPSGVLQMGRVGSAAGTLLAADKTLIDAAHPLDVVPISGRNEAYNLMDAFAVAWKADAANAGKTLVLIPCAEGGTSVADGAPWSPVPTVGARLADMVDRINTFFAAYPGAEMGGFIWHQGESDGANATYSLLFERMRKYVIDNCPRITGATPWITGGNMGDTSSFAFNSQKVFPDTIPYTAHASSAGTTGVDTLHFTNASLDIMGGRYYAAVADAVANNDVDLGLANAFGFADLNTGSYLAQRIGVTTITDGYNFRLNAGETLVRRAWRSVPPAGYFAWTAYRVRFTAERDDATDIVNFAAGSAFGSNNFGQATIAIPINTPTELEFVFNTRNIVFSPNGIFFSVISTGPTETNVKITNVRFTRTIEE